MFKAKVTNYSKKWSVGVGWEPLLDLCETVLKNIEWGYKEKYAQLRIELYEGVEEKILKFTDEIEYLSAFVCENCGAMGEMRTDGWNKTMCDECYGVWENSSGKTKI